MQTCRNDDFGIMFSKHGSNETIYASGIINGRKWSTERLPYSDKSFMSDVAFDIYTGIAILEKEIISRANAVSLKNRYSISGEKGNEEKTNRIA